MSQSYFDLACSIALPPEARFIECPRYGCVWEPGEMGDKCPVCGLADDSDAQDNI